MTIFSETNSSIKTGSINQQPLIPPASIRAERSSSVASVASRVYHQQKQKHQDQKMRPSGKSANQNQNQIPSSQNINSGSGSEEVWTSMENLFWDHMNEVENKWNTLKLNDDIWAKLIYFEQNRRLAKAYVSAPVLTVDGSTHGLDGFRIGLSGIDNSYRNLDSIACLRSIGHGIKLKIDNHGNILIRKAGQAIQNNSTGHCSVWVKDWPLPMTAPSSATTKSTKQSSLTDTCVMREIEQSDASYKLFDMRRFRLQLEKRRLNNEQVMDWRQCVSIVSFVQSKDVPNNKHKLLEDPCWLMLINIIAIDMIKSSLNRRSSINLDLELHDGPSNVMHHDHSLLESGNYARTVDGPFRASSSSSILFPTSGSTAASSIYNYRGNPLSGTADSVNNLSIATNERIKKLRTANSKYRLSSMKNGSYHRRYQSIQQLSSAALPNNTIYTTFNSKFINNINNINNNNAHKAAQMINADNSSTSDYNSVSRSTSSGHRLNNLKLLYNDSPVDSSAKLQQQQRRIPSSSNSSSGGSSRYHRDEGKMLFSRKALEPLLDLGNKSLSLSTFDLSHKRFDLRSMQSSIKMNYDYLTETDDTLAYEEEEDDEHDDEEKSVISNGADHHDPRSFMTPGCKHVILLSNHLNSHPKSIPNFTLNSKKEKTKTSCCCTTGEKVKHCNHEHIKQHSQDPFKVGRDESNGNLVEEEQAGTRNEHHQQKVSRSSIASSSSSSGCADNDYFMSQSSSSMSSSTASNERELFSQPASSSGIVCSGSTSDEYEDGQNKQAVKSDTVSVSAEQLHVTNSSKSSTSTPESAVEISKENEVPIEESGVESRAKSKQQQVASKKSQTSKLNIRRGYLKTIEPADYCCPPLDVVGSDQECQCPTLDYNCHCCCDCFSSSMGPTTCGYEDDLIFDRLQQHSASTPNQPTTTTSITINSSKANKKGEKELTNRHEKVVVPSSLGKADEKLSNSATILLQQQDLCLNKSTKDLKQTSGWLERRKYSKILPKFIFSSGPSSRHMANATNSTTTDQRDKITQRDKSNLKHDKFRFTSKSNQDLS